MRKISIQESDTKEWKKWIQDCKEATNQLIAKAEKGEKLKINGNLYKRDNIKKIHFASKEAPFYGRCAYCETPIVDFQYIDVEHFRPKAGVKDADGREIYLKDKQGNKILDIAGKEIPHPGYYWLAYDWHNLVPSCQICNRPKSTKFPVIGNHAQAPGEELNETPLLINPIDEDPEKHLSVVADDGTMYALNDSDRGKMCIKIFDLNRDQLLSGRKKAKNHVNFLILEIDNLCKELNNPNQSKIETCEKLIKKYDVLIKIWEGAEEYTLAFRCYLKSKNYTSEWLQKTLQSLVTFISELMKV